MLAKTTGIPGRVCLLSVISTNGWLCVGCLKQVLIYTLVPHSGQNLAPLTSVPQFEQTVAAGITSILAPQWGQNLAPAAGCPHWGQVAASGWIMGVPHSGQNLVPGGAR